MKDKDVIDFFFELGQMRRVKHEGWRIAGIELPDSVAEHALRASQIGYVLAVMEDYERPYEVCTMLVFHDMGECRVGDIHKVANRYIDADEEGAVNEQLDRVKPLKQDLLSLWKQVEYMSSTAGVIAKDADLLEQAVTAKEYIERGYGFAKDWIKNVSKRLKTRSAKRLIKALVKGNSNNWWQGLKVLYKKKK